MTAAGIISAAILDPATGQLVGVNPALLVLATAYLNIRLMILPIHFGVVSRTVEEVQVAHMVSIVMETFITEMAVQEVLMVVTV